MQFIIHYLNLNEVVAMSSVFCSDALTVVHSHLSYPQIKFQRYSVTSKSERVSETCMYSVQNERANELAVIKQSHGQLCKSWWGLDLRWV